MGQDDNPPSVVGTGSDIYVTRPSMRGEIHGAERCDFRFEPIVGTPAVAGPVAAASDSAGMPVCADREVDQHIDNTWGPWGMPMHSSAGFPVFAEHFFINYSEVQKAFSRLTTRL